LERRLIAYNDLAHLISQPCNVWDNRKGGPTEYLTNRAVPQEPAGIDTLTTITCQYRCLAHSRSQQNQSLAIVAANPKRLRERLYWVNVSMPSHPMLDCCPIANSTMRSPQS